MKTAWALPQIDADRCDGCGECVEVCPTGALALVQGAAAITAPAACDYCTACEPVCSAGAISCPFEVVLAAG